MPVTRIAWIVLPLIVLAFAGTAAANDSLRSPFGLPDYGVDAPGPQMSGAGLPWLSQEDVYYNADKSVYWNQNFRGGMGQVRFNPVEYIIYDYNNKTNTGDEGEIKEVHHTITLAGTPVPNVRVFATAGVNTIAFNRGNDGVEQFVNHTGLTFEMGLEFGFPILDFLTLQGRGFWRQWNAARSDDVDNVGFSQQWHGQLLIAVEPFGGRDSFTLDAYAGIGYHYIMQRWQFGTDDVEQITPDNSSSLSNGPERIDIIVGVSLIPFEWLAFNFEARFVGPTTLVGSLAFIF